MAADLRSLARAVLLAFADLGIYLSSDRDTIVETSRRMNTGDANEVSEFLGLCIDAGLVGPGEADRLRLNPEEARRLAHSLDGHTPVPDEQAGAWARALRSA